MSVQVQHRRDTRATIMGKTPAAGELGFATDTHEMTMGDGTTLGGTWAHKKNQSETLVVTGLTGTVNNWSPAGFTLHTGSISMAATATTSITGIANPGLSGRVLELYNIGTFPIVLKALNAGSSVANRFSFNADLQLDPNGGARLVYDSAQQLWYCLATTTSMTGTGAALLSGNNLSDVASPSTSRTNLGLGTIATQGANAVAITGGAIDGATVGATTRAAGNFSQLGVGTSAPRVELEVTSATPNIALTDSSAGANLKTFDQVASAGVLSWRVVDDTYATANAYMTVARSGVSTPGLVTFPAAAGVTVAGPATLNGALNASPSNANITLSPTGSGTVNINPAVAGSINNVSVGASSPNSGNFTTLNGTRGGVQSAAGATYAWQGWNQSNVSSAGGVIGLTGSAGTIYGILGYQTGGVSYSFYGNGAFYNTGGNGQFTGSLSVGNGLTVTGSGVFSTTLQVGGQISWSNITNFLVGYAGVSNINYNSAFYLYGGGTGTLSMFGATQFYPMNDNTCACGLSSFRWTAVYAVNGTIQTSDAQEKQDIVELEEAEMRVAKKLKGMVRKYRWIADLDKQKKEGKRAKLACGIIAQDIEQAFRDEGLDPDDYSMWEKSEIEEDVLKEKPDPDGCAYDRVPTGKFRYGVNYSQLLCFIIAAM